MPGKRKSSNKFSNEFFCANEVPESLDSIEVESMKKLQLLPDPLTGASKYTNEF